MRNHSADAGGIRDTAVLGDKQARRRRRRRRRFDGDVHGGGAACDHSAGSGEHRQEGVDGAAG